MAMELIVLAIIAAAIGYVVVAVRRARREQRARSEERSAALIAALQSGRGSNRSETAAGGASTGATATTDAAPSSAAATISPAPPLAAMRRARFLTEPQRLLYLVLRAALPDHVVMANTRMVDLLDLPPDAEALEHDARLREMLHQRIDCMVCRSDLVPLAAIVVYAPGAAAPSDECSQAERLHELGIRFLRFRSDSLPRPAEMRTLVLG